MIATAAGLLPTVIAVLAVLVAVSIGMTEPELVLVTYAVFPSGVIATPSGSLPTAIAVPAVLVAVSIGVTEFESRLVT